jgi:predicted nucleic acid-binding protein
MILVDTSVLLDVLQDDPVWAEWSLAQLESASVVDRLAINDVIYAELSIAFARIEELEAVLERTALQVEPIPREALFLAGKAFMAYRRSAGSRQQLLPDFFVGAQAAVLGCPLLTRDARRYRTYFPTVQLVSPP